MRCSSRLRRGIGVVGEAISVPCLVIALLQHQTNSLRPRLRVVPARHEMHLAKKGGAHQTRDGSLHLLLNGSASRAAVALATSPSEITGAP